MGAKTIRFPETSAIGIKPVSEEGSKRLIRSALQYAVENRLPSLTLRIWFAGSACSRLPR